MKRIEQKVAPRIIWTVLIVLTIYIILSDWSLFPLFPQLLTSVAQHNPNLFIAFVIALLLVLTSFSIHIYQHLIKYFKKKGNKSAIALLSLDQIIFLIITTVAFALFLLAIFIKLIIYLIA
ncbi:hypothetical protein A2Z22_02525 [Candidatus Woesebacteria bacterium RBG_16_34_12]|uniref:Uncharacterized protein n=1 Tax=Candidatus Woesebacteria bacterium RBG_16_34_12 TaxID=1802480 RepID=A0A1F7X9M4_9BACT|nr:MAG: hypothetical protein A2Z22_02525 [Candidatus Woesebacteria bacterium RBG_16_34_12]